MNDHLTKHRAEMARQAWPAVERFIQEHPDYTIAADQSRSLSNTNYVIFGQRGEEPVVFKYFCRDERKERELFALRHFAATGVVPHLLAEDGPRLLVISHIPGDWLPDARETTVADADRALAGRTLGQTVAKLMTTPLSATAAHTFESRFYDGESLTTYLQNILQASWAIHRQIDCYHAPIFGQSLATIEANLPYILGQPRLLYHQDALNVHFLDYRCSGFFDLEMCRVGTASMQIGSLWWLLVTQKLWDDFAQGVAEVTGRALSAEDFAASRAFAHFLVWRYIADYGDWHGTPLSDTVMAAEVEKAVGYRQSIELFNAF